MVRKTLSVCAVITCAIGGLLGPGTAVATPSSLPAKSPPMGVWHGTSTNMDRTFNYGRVTFTMGRGVITDFVIEGVTVSGCGGYKNVVVPKLTVRGIKVTGAYQPVPGIDDIITVTGSIAGGAIRGTFTEGPLCSGAGRFIARPG